MFETKAKTKDTSIKKEKLLTQTFLTASLAKRITFKVYQTQPGHVQRFCVIPVVRLSLVGPSSFDCVYNFSQASSQHKYTVTSHLAYDNIHTVLSCPA